MQEFKDMTITEYNLFLIDSFQELIVYFFTFQFNKLDGSHIYTFGIFLIIISIILNIFIK